VYPKSNPQIITVAKSRFPLTLTLSQRERGLNSLSLEGEGRGEGDRILQKPKKRHSIPSLPV